MNKKVYDSLYILKVGGYDGEIAPGYPHVPGSASWLCLESDAVIWFDNDTIPSLPLAFTVLIAGADKEDFIKLAERDDYEVIDQEEVKEPMWYGDDNRIVEILKHRRGWVVIR